MARPVTLLVVFFLSLNLFAGVLVSTGAAATLGISAEVGGDESTDQLTGEQTGNLTTGSPSDGTLFGLYNVVGSQIAGIYDFLFPGLVMLKTAGVPAFITDLILAPLFGLLITIDLAAIVRGYDI